MQETDQLTNSIDGKEAHNPSLKKKRLALKACLKKRDTQYRRKDFYLDEKEGLEQKIEEHVCDDLTDAGKRLSFTSRHFKRQISNVLHNKTAPNQHLLI